MGQDFQNELQLSEIRKLWGTTHLFINPEHSAQSAEPKLSERTDKLNLSIMGVQIKQRNGLRPA
jgi:hypothetical protein